MFGSQINHSTFVNRPEQQFQDTLPLQSQISDSRIWSLNLSKPCVASSKLAIMELACPVRSGAHLKWSEASRALKAVLVKGSGLLANTFGALAAPQFLMNNFKGQQHATTFVSTRVLFSLGRGRRQVHPSDKGNPQARTAGKPRKG